jgi:exodeoxyribonuclease V alpha subunit
MKAICEIRNGKIPKYLRDSDYQRIITDDVEDVLLNIANQYRSNPKGLLIITPFNSTIAKYQNIIRDCLNSNHEVFLKKGDRFEFPFSINDRVIQTKNVYNTTNPRFNGMMGTIQMIEKNVVVCDEVKNGQKCIVEIDKSFVDVEFDNTNVERYTWKDAENELNLAYILSIHKAQGSEAETVVVILEDKGFLSPLLSRNLIYTAISRASKKCIVIGSSKTYKHCIKTCPPVRQTRLCEFLVCNGK